MERTSAAMNIRNIPQLYTWNSHLLVLKLLLDSDANVSPVTISGYSALHKGTPIYFAAFEGQFEFIKTLLDHGADLNVVWRHQETPLGAACIRGHFGAVKVLCENRADVKLTETDGSTALHLAAKHDHIVIVQYLLENTDIEIEAKNMVGETPLLKEADREYFSIAKLLV